MLQGADLATLWPDPLTKHIQEIVEHDLNWPTYLA